jgi:hypothetical protein
MVLSIKHKINKFRTPSKKTGGLPVSLRSYADELDYAFKKKTQQLKSFLEEEVIQEWKHWALIENAFPYSSVFKVNHMLIPKREVDKAGLNKKESSELELILEELSDIYDCHLTNFPGKQSRKNHFHIHMLIYKDKRSEIRI